MNLFTKFTIEKDSAQELRAAVDHAYEVRRLSSEAFKELREHNAKLQTLPLEDAPAWSLEARRLSDLIDVYDDLLRMADADVERLKNRQHQESHVFTSQKSVCTSQK